MRLKERTSRGICRQESVLREDVPRDGMSTQDIEEIQKIQSVDIDYHTNFYRCNSVNKIMR